MENKKFKKPDEAALKRMTVGSIDSLLETLRAKRVEKVQYIDEEIAYYEGLREEKKGGAQ